ncbi:MAG: 50S ribosomal protein L1 [Candidatus Hydrogenedentota bacterium]
MKRGKRYRELITKYKKDKEYEIEEALKLTKSLATAKFDETIELAMNMNLDPTKSEQKIRGTVSLPHGIGKKIRVIVFAKGEKEKEAKESGADYVGAEDLIEKIMKEGWTDFDVAIAPPDMMKEVGKLGKILGPRGLMPNPKTGTVTFEIKEAVKEFKAGKIEINVDKFSNIHLPIGKASFTEDKLQDNLITTLETVLRMKPATVKGAYIKSITLCSTMGPAVKIKVSELKKVA